MIEAKIKHFEGVNNLTSYTLVNEDEIVGRLKACMEHKMSVELVLDYMTLDDVNKEYTILLRSI